MDILSRSILYTLEPIGIGTEFTECLTNYLARLALAHDSTVGMLLKGCIWPFVQNCDMKTKTKNIYPGMSANTRHQYWLMNGIQTPAAQWVELLQDLTKRNDLAYLTMLPWKGMIRGIGLMRKRLFFCALCLDEQRTQIKYPNIPLLWCFASVKTCPKHMVYLEDKCLNCLSSLPIICTKSIPGYCPKCGDSIRGSENSVNLKFVERSSQDHWITAHFSELVKNNNDPDNITSTGIDNRKIFPIFKQNHQTQSKHVLLLSKALNLPRHRIARWEKEHALPFEVFLKSTYESNLSIFRIYEFADTKVSRNIKAVIKEFNENRKEFTEKIFKLLKGGDGVYTLCGMLGIQKNTLKTNYPDLYEYLKSLVNQNQENLITDCLKKMNLVLQDPIYVPSLGQIATEIGVTTNFLKKIDPELSKVIIQKHEESVKTRQEKTIIRCQIEAIDCLRRLTEMSIPITERNLKYYLDQPGILRIPGVRQAIHDYRLQIGK